MAAAQAGDIYMNSNLNPLTKFTSRRRSTEFKDILPWNTSQMIIKTIPISTRIVISYSLNSFLLNFFSPLYPLFFIPGVEVLLSLTDFST